MLNDGGGPFGSSVVDSGKGAADSIGVDVGSGGIA